MITHEVKKIWFGDSTYKQAKITLRSYWVNEALKRNETIKVVYIYGDRNKFMLLTPKKLLKPVSERTFKSKIGKEDYKLLDYFWKPDNNI